MRCVGTTRRRGRNQQMKSRDCASKRKRCSQLSTSTSAKLLVGLRFRYIERPPPSCNGNNRPRLCENTLDTLKAEACGFTWGIG